ncbi:hypothetical protein DIPPA_14379, partial [Diplonema papillatum]
DQFVQQYGGTKEWDEAPLDVERRIDPSDGLAYTKEDFVAQYGGLAQWDAAGQKNIDTQEKRIDPADGMAYTKEEFHECYGGYDEWESATTHDELPQRPRRRQR